MEPPPKVDMEMIPSSHSIARSVVGDQVFGDVSEDFTQGLSSHEKKTPSLKPLHAQTPREGAMLATEAINLMTTFIEEHVKGLLKREPSRLQLTCCHKDQEGRSMLLW